MKIKRYCLWLIFKGDIKMGRIELATPLGCTVRGLPLDYEGVLVIVVAHFLSKHLQSSGKK